MRVAYLSPLPPTRSGISVYSEMLLPALAARLDIVAVDEHPAQTAIGGIPVISLAEYVGRRSEFDAAIYQMGNNPYHEWIYREAMEHPGVLVLHDFVLHHLIVEMTLARGLAEEYVEIMRTNHGAVGEAWARGREAGFHDELGNFLFPGSRQIAQRSRSVIVHNRYAADQLRLMGVDRPITVAPMSFEVRVDPAGEARRAVRDRLGFMDHHRVIGMFGFVTASKRPEVVLEAFSLAVRKNPNLQLLIVGEPAPNCDMGEMVAHFGLDTSMVHATGYVAEDAFDGYLAASDRIVNLRYPTAGETSGALLRIFAAGRPVAVSELAQFIEFPDLIASKIPLGEEEVDALRSFILDSADPGPLARAQRTWLTEHGGTKEAAGAYLEALSKTEPVVVYRASTGPIPLFPDLRLVNIDESSVGRLAVTLRNEAQMTVRAAVFGTPGYRMIVKLFEGSEEILNRWLSLEADLHSGEETTLTLALPVGAAGRELRLHHALEGVPLLDLGPFAVSRLSSSGQT